HNARTGHTVFYASVDVSDFAVHIAPRRIHLDIAVRNQPDQERNDDQSHERKLRIDPEHDAERAEERHDGNEEVFRSVMGKLPDVEQVIGDAAHDVAGLDIVEKAERLPLHMGEQFFTHVGFNIDAELVPEITDDILKERTEQEHCQE